MAATISHARRWVACLTVSGPRWVLLFPDEAIRDRVRRELTAARIHTAILHRILEALRVAVGG